MKRTINIWLSILLSLICLAPSNILAEEKTLSSNLDVATNAMQVYLESSSWSEFEISNAEKIYDANLEEYGYIFELHNGIQEGYGIVVEFENDYIFVEGSIETPSPYKSVQKGTKNVYTSALNYFSYNPLLRGTEKFRNIETNEMFAREDINNDRVVVASDKSASRTRSSSVQEKYIRLYPLAFVSINQPSGSSSCIPYSTIMALKYLDNATTSFELDNNRSLRDLAESLYTTMNGGSGRVNDTQARDGISTWSSNAANCNKHVTFTADWTYTPNVAPLAPVKAKIDVNIPVVCMFKAGVLNDYDHATTMVGYRTEQRDVYDGSLDVAYAIVKDPGSSSVPERTVIWSTSNILGYYLINIQ